MSKKKSGNFKQQKRKNVAKNILTGTVIVLSLTAVGLGTGAVVDCAKTLYALQTESAEITSCLIKFHDTRVNTPVIVQEVELSEGKTPAGRLLKTPFSWMGYTFAGWSLTAAPEDGFATKVDYTDEAALSDIDTLGSTAAIDLYAVLKSTINLDQQGGINGNTSTATIVGGNFSVIPPKRTGYTFAGYFTYKNGTGVKYIDENGQGILPNELPNGTSLYANWVQISD